MIFVLSVRVMGGVLTGVPLKNGTLYWERRQECNIYWIQFVFKKDMEKLRDRM